MTAAAGVSMLCSNRRLDSSALRGNAQTGKIKRHMRGGSVGEVNKERSGAYQEMSDEALIGRVRAGDEGAARVLFERHRGRVYALAYSYLGDRESALDVVQEVFGRVFGALWRFRSGARFTTWLYRIALNCCYDALRRRRSHPEEPAEQDVFALRGGDCEGPDASARRSELSAALRRAIAKLSPKLRDVFLLRFAEGLSYKEIANTLGINVGTVMSRLFYARQALREMLSDFL